MQEGQYKTLGQVENESRVPRVESQCLGYPSRSRSFKKYISLVHNKRPLGVKGVFCFRNNCLPSALPLQELDALSSK